MSLRRAVSTLCSTVRYSRLPHTAVRVQGSGSQFFQQFSRYSTHSEASVGTLPAYTPVFGQGKRPRFLPSEFALAFKKPDIVVPVSSLTATPADLGTVGLPNGIFGAPIRVDIIHQVVVWQQAKRRQGTHRALTRGEVSGSGKKMFNQKGTGNARMGDKRNPLRRHGGVIHPPRPRDYSYPLNKKLRALGLRAALSSKLAEGRVTVLDSDKYHEPTTKGLAAVMKARGWTKKVVILTGPTMDENLVRAAGNLYVHVLPVQGANVLSIVGCDNLLVTREALEGLKARFCE